MALLSVAAMAVSAPAWSQIAPTKAGVPPLRVQASTQLTYDSNIFRYDKSRPSVDDLLVTPRVVVEYRKPIGQHDIAVRADVAYSYYTSHAGRSRIRAELAADGNIRVAGQCLLQPLAEILRQKADYGDINGASDNLQTFTTLEVKASCPRPAGLYPLAEFARTTTRNDRAFNYSDQTSLRYKGGVGYNLPSIGRFTAYYAHLRSDRDKLGIINNVDQAGVTFDRQVVTRFAVQADLHYLHARSSAGGVSSYSGPGWNLALIFRPIPSLLFKGESGRRIVNDTLVPAGFAVVSEYALRSEWTLHERTILRLGFEHGDRTFRRDPLVIFSPIGSDKYTNLLAGVTRSIGRKIDLNLDVRHITRRTDSGVSDFNATLATVGVSLEL